MAINLLDAGQLQFHEPNYCNDSSLLEEAGLRRSPLGQFIGYPCSAEFYHCRWQSNGFLTYKKACKQGLVYDTLGTQNCNFDFNIKGCGMRSDGGENCQKNEFSCPLSESCVSLSQRCDGNYDCLLEEDEQNCLCDGTANCPDGSDEKYCTQSPMQPPQGPSPPMPSQSASFPMANANEIADYDRIQQERYIQEQQQPEAEAEEEEETEEEGSDDPPIAPLMPRFIPTFTTTTKKPTTKIYTAAIRVEPVKLPKKPTVNPRIEVKPRKITSSISEVAVTAAPALIAAVTTRKPISYVRPMVPNREKVVASITITTTSPQVPTFPTIAIKEKEEETMGQIEEELIAKLGARLNNQNKFSARFE
uniref:Chitin-binding type-2 domain-containing protein n=1 Tax=Panagrolaimus sp. PS1159 TaxID=55785 RepID=A0AC35FPD5_9BILA